MTAPELTAGFTPDPQKMAAVVEGIDIADTAIRLMICDELRARLPALEEAEAEAAQELQDAFSVLQPMEQGIADIEREISEAEGSAGTYREQLESDLMPERVAAQVWFEQWQRQLGKLQQKRDLAEQEIMPYRQERDQAQQRLARVQDDKNLTEFNASSPDYAYSGFGTKTSAFFQWGYFGRFVQTLLSGNKGGHLWDEAVEFMDYLCERSGYRTEERKLPTDAEHYRKFWHEIYARANPPVPEQSGAEIISGLHAQQQAIYDVAREQGRLERTVTEDHRQPGKRPFMNVPRVPDELRGRGQLHSSRCPVLCGCRSPPATPGGGLLTV